MEVFELIHGMARTDENLIRSADELDKAIDHIVSLIQDACTLYFAGGYSSSAFLSITACEEVAKAHIGSFTDGKHPEKEGRNVFRDHKTKHAMAALPTVPMGQRLEEALSKDELRRVMNLAQNAGFVQARENALYFPRNSGLTTITTRNCLIVKGSFYSYRSYRRLEGYFRWEKRQFKQQKCQEVSESG